jgi:hypothetical protein
MRRLPLILCWLLLPLVVERAAGQRPPAGLTAAQLAAKVIAVRQERGFRIRAAMTRTTPGSTIRDVRHLLIKGRRDEGSLMLYQQVWPEVPGGRALVIEDSGNHRLTGFEYESGRVTTLSDQMLGRRFFDSDLTLEDLAENFWYWPAPSRGPEQDIGSYRTVAVDFRPSPATASTYSMVRTWVAPDLGLGLRIQVWGRPGGLAKTIGFYRILRFGDRWVAGIVTVEPTDRMSRTVLEGVKGERDVPVSRSEFTPAAVRKSLLAPAL